MEREQAHIQEKQSTQTHTQAHTFTSHIQLTHSTHLSSAPLVLAAFPLLRSFPLPPPPTGATRSLADVGCKCGMGAFTFWPGWHPGQRFV